MILKSIDIDLFQNIHIDSVYLFIGNKKIPRSSVGIYNQVADYMNYKMSSKLKLFLEWLKQEYNVDELDESIIKKWEEGLLLSVKKNLYGEAFRIRYKDNNKIEFYSLVDGNLIEYLSNTDDAALYRILANYLLYTPKINDICNKLDLPHPADEGHGTMHIAKEIKLALRYNLIPRIDEYVVLSNDKKQYCLAYYNLKQGNPNAETPAWDNFLFQMESENMRECFMAWIYSVFDANNFGRQICWLQGMGDTGKSVVGNVIYKRIARLNQHVVGTLENYKYQDKFTMSSFVNKRFCLDADSQNYAIVRMGLIKNITGRDTVTIRGLNTLKTSTQIYSKILCTSNRKPYVNTNKAEELTRILYIPLNSKLCRDRYLYWFENHKNEDWQECLENEIDNFIARCKIHYDKLLNADGHNIKIYDGMIDELDDNLYALKRELPFWWNHCLVQTDKLEDIVTMEDLIADYMRYLSSYKLSYFAKRDCRSFVFTHVRILLVPMYKLKHSNEVYIRGYTFTDSNDKNRATTEKLRNIELQKQREHPDDEILPQ